MSGLESILKECGLGSVFDISHLWRLAQILDVVKLATMDGVDFTLQRVRLLSFVSSKFLILMV